MNTSPDEGWYGGDVVCVAVVPRGQIIDWSPNSYEPELAVWMPQEAFERILAEADRLRLPTLEGLDIYAQSRLSSVEAGYLLARWREVEDRLEHTPGAGWAAAVRLVLRVCSTASEPVELLIEGP